MSPYPIVVTVSLFFIIPLYTCCNLDPIEEGSDHGLTMLFYVCSQLFCVMSQFVFCWLGVKMSLCFAVLESRSQV